MSSKLIWNHHPGRLTTRYELCSYERPNQRPSSMYAGACRFVQLTFLILMLTLNDQDMTMETSEDWHSTTS